MLHPPSKLYGCSWSCSPVHIISWSSSSRFLFWCTVCCPQVLGWFVSQPGNMDKLKRRWSVLLVFVLTLTFLSWTVWGWGWGDSSKLLLFHEQISYDGTNQQLENILLHLGGSDGRGGEPRVKPGKLERGGRRLTKPILRWDLVACNTLFLHIWLNLFARWRSWRRSTRRSVQRKRRRLGPTQMSRFGFTIALQSGSYVSLWSTLLWSL